MTMLRPTFATSAGRHPADSARPIRGSVLFRGNTAVPLPPGRRQCSDQLWRRCRQTWPRHWHDLAPHQGPARPPCPVSSPDASADLSQHLIQAHRDCPHWQLALADNTDAFPLDRPDGYYGPAMARIARATPTTVEAMNQALTSKVLHDCTLGSARGTHLKAWRNWRSCLTWAVWPQHTRPSSPTGHDTLLATLWDSTAMGVSRPSLNSIVVAAIVRYRD